MKSSSIQDKIKPLLQEKQSPGDKISLGKGKKLVWCKEPYEPNANYFNELVGRDREIRLVTAAWIGGRHTPPLCPILVGDPGVGKNRLVYELARMSNRELYIMQGHEDVTAEDMACAVRFSDEGDSQVDYAVSDLATAMIFGGICFIDEIGKVRPRALALLASVLDERRYLDSTLLGERIHAAPGFRLIAATNSGDLNMLPEFIRSRLWPVITIGYPKKTELKSIIGHQFPEMQSQIETLFDTFWMLWEKHYDSEKHPSPRDAIHLFSLASSLYDLETFKASHETPPVERAVVAPRSKTLNLDPSQLESAFNHLFEKGAP